jgi:hypothetical protein
MIETDPEAAGFDGEGLADAIAFHRAHETPWPTSMILPDGRYIGTASIGDRPEHAAVIGPIRPRGGPNGLIFRQGRLAAEWGDTARADMTFSISKSYLALLAGLALHDGLIGDLDDRVRATVDQPWFATPHNAEITWAHLLQLTSEWSGTLWGKPDSADHNRVVGGADQPTDGKGAPRALKPPGTHFEYNDVRVNLLAACLTTRFGRPLPDVLRERVMAPIGASTDWEWHGYEGANVIRDGLPVRAVSGGGHWGGGMFIGSRDHALMGTLVLRDGAWNGARILPRGWVARMLAPSPRNPGYGMLWWLNGGAAPRFPSAPADSVFALGAGGHVIWIAQSLDIVAVLRWIDGAHIDGMLARIMAALRARATNTSDTDGSV